MSVKNKKAKMSIGTKLLLFTLLFTIIPLFITATLIIYTYQDLINTLLAEEDIHVSEVVMRGLSGALENAKIQAVLTVFIVIILTLFSNTLISRGLTLPLQKLVKGTKEVSKGNLDFEIKVGSHDELGDLALHFNNMTRELEEAQEDLRESKKGLEKKVKLRTKELEDAMDALEDAKATLEIKVRARTEELGRMNKGLDEQIKERTKELQYKIKELEKFQEIAIGRELKMVELKKELDNIKKDNKDR